MAFARTGPDEAVSNLSKWLERGGLHRIPGWLRARVIDKWAIRGAMLAMAVLLFVGGIGFDSWVRGFSSPFPEVSPYHWQPLTPEESLSLRSAIRDIMPEGEAMFILCAEADCDDLAKSFRDVFRDLKWNVNCCAYGFGTFPPGVHLWASSAYLQEIASKIEMATKGRLKLSNVQMYIMDPARFNLQIFIGPKS